MTAPTQVEYAEYKARPKPRYFAHFDNNGMQPLGRQTIQATANRATRRASTKHTRRPSVRISPRAAPYSMYPFRTSLVLRLMRRELRAQEGTTV